MVRHGVIHAVVRPCYVLYFECVVGAAGDSRAIIVQQQGHVVALSEDHKVPPNSHKTVMAWVTSCLLFLCTVCSQTDRMKPRAFGKRVATCISMACGESPVCWLCHGTLGVCMSCLGTHVLSTVRFQSHW